MSHRVLRPAALTALLLAASCGDPLDEVRELQERREFQASLEPLQALLEERPDDPEVHLRYGAALIGTGQPSLALWPLRRAAESEEWRSMANHNLATAYVMAGSYGKAIEVASLEVERNPDDVEPLLLRAKASVYSKRDWEAVLEDTERVLEIDPENRDALAPRAVALLALQRVEEAAAVIEELEAVHRDDALGLHGSPGLCAARARFADEKGDLEEAEERYVACLERFPSHAVLVDQAMALFDRTDRNERATEILRVALDDAPEARHYRMALAARLRAQGREEEAEGVLREGTEHENPLVAAEAWAALAASLTQSGDYEGAVEAWGEARRRAGDDDLILLSTADAMVLAGRHDEALALTEAMSTGSYADLVRGRVALVRGEPRKALAHFSEGIRLWPNNPFARYYAAVAAEQVGDFELAVEHYRYAMRINARATDAYLRLARLHDAAGRPEPALAALGFSPGGRPSEREAALLELEILTRLGRGGRTPERVLRQLGEDHRGAAAAALAAGVAARAGSEHAAAAIRAVEDLDLRDPVHFEALAGLVQHLMAAGRTGEAWAEVEGALEARPEAAAFHALHGQLLARAGRREEARAAFERALQREAETRQALLGLARLDLEAGAPEAALARYDRVSADDARDPSAARGAAEALVALGRKAEAEERLLAVLGDRPYDVEAALRLAELRLERGAAGERTRELARRALRFGGGERAERLGERLGVGGSTGEASSG